MNSPFAGQGGFCFLVRGQESLYFYGLLNFQDHNLTVKSELI